MIGEMGKRAGWSTKAMSALLLAGIVIGLFLFGSLPTLDHNDVLSVPEETPSSVDVMPGTSSKASSDAVMLDRAPLTSIVHQAKHYELNLVETFDDVRNRCLPEWDRQQCNDMTRNFLRERNQDNDKAELLKVYDQYIQYEDYVAAHQPLQNLDLENTYQVLQQLRTQFIDADIRAWLFGPEDARMAYEIAKRDFVAQDAVRLKPVERLQRLEQLRQTHLGEYYLLFLSREDPVDYYQLQLELLTMGPEISEETARLASVIQEKILATNTSTATHAP